MRIAFVTTCLEPGKDGVGDYTRDLAAECVRRGHVCDLIAINDRCLTTAASLQEDQAARGTAVEVLRFAATIPWSQRLLATRTHVERTSPDWVSLQFVPYGFHSKGLVGHLGAGLASLVADRKVHVMFHELWIGAELGAPLRHRLMGRLQRRAILSMLKMLDPDVVHTSNWAYLARLRAAGVQTRLLTLCGNIPFAPQVHPSGATWLQSEVEKLGLAANGLMQRDACWWFGLFGSLHPEWTPEPLFSHLAEAGQRASRRIVIAAIGAQGSTSALWKDLAARYADRFSFVNFGERSATEISRFMQGVDFGIATTPWLIIGKSGSTAAMLEHGLPVIVSRDDVRLPLEVEEPQHPQLFKMDCSLPQRLIAASRGPPRDGLRTSTDAFLADLA
jgi:hypothetical protein